MQTLRVTPGPWTEWVPKMYGDQQKRPFDQKDASFFRSWFGHLKLPETQVSVQMAQDRFERVPILIRSVCFASLCTYSAIFIRAAYTLLPFVVKLLTVHGYSVAHIP